MVELPVEIWTHIIRVATEWQPSCAWWHGSLDHPAVALSQTTKWLRTLAAPRLWRDVTVTGGRGEVFYRVKKLTICLNDPLVRNSIQTLNLDLGNHGYQGLFERSPNAFEGPPCAPTYFDYLGLMTRLGEALAGSALAELRVDAESLHPSDGFIEALGEGCPKLHHIDIGYGADAMPWPVTLDDVKINGPDPLHLLSQVRSASIGMGNFHDSHSMRDSDYFDFDLESHWNIPYFIYWLRGNRLGRSGPEEEDNNLVNIKTNAPFLYHCRALIPAWARFNRIQEHAIFEGSFEEGLARFPNGECVEIEDEESQAQYIHAAMAIRPSLDQLAEGRLSSDITAAEVVRMIRTQNIFVPWRSEFFPSSEPGDTAYDESLVLAEEILYHWRKSEGSRRADPGPCERWHTGSWPI